MSTVQINGNCNNINGTTYLDPQLQSILIDEDFICASLNATCLPATVTNSGSVAFAGMTGRLGCVSLTTGTVSAAGTASMGSNVNVVALGVSGQFISLESEVYVFNNLSDGTDSFIVTSGYGDNLSGAAQTDGAFFRYTHSENAGRWTLVLVKGGVETTLDSGITVVVNTWYNLRIDSYGNSFTFYINDINVGTMTGTFAPATEFTGVITGIWKTLGTANRVLRVDWVYMYAIHGSR